MGRPLRGRRAALSAGLAGQFRLARLPYRHGHHPGRHARPLALAVAAFPPRACPHAGTDALEFALVTLLIVMFSPLSFNYAYVWLIYPLTVALHWRGQTEPARGAWRKLELAWIVAVFFIPSLAILNPLYAQAYGNLFVPALLMVIGLALRLRVMGRETRAADGPQHVTVARRPPCLTGKPAVVLINRGWPRT